MLVKVHVQLDGFVFLFKRISVCTCTQYSEPLCKLVRVKLLLSVLYTISCRSNMEE